MDLHFGVAEDWYEVIGDAFARSGIDALVLRDIDQAIGEHDDVALGAGIGLEPVDARRAQRTFDVGVEPGGIDLGGRLFGARFPRRVHGAVGYQHVDLLTIGPHSGMHAIW